jgi:hypothetical protein
MPLKSHCSPNRELFGIIYPEEPPFNVSRVNIFTYLTLNFNDCKSVISVLNFPFSIYFVSLFKVCSIASCCIGSTEI